MKINIPIPISLHRHRKHLSNGLYLFLIAVFAFILVDPGSMVNSVLFGTSPRVKHNSLLDNNGGKEDENFYNLLGADFAPAPKPTPMRTVHLPWLPKQHKCEGLFERAGHNFSYSDFYWEHVDAFKGALQSSDIMRESYVDEVSWIFHEMSMMDFVETVCETGFRAGHFTFHWLTGRPEIVVYSFEANKFNFTDDMVTFMTAEFPDRFYFHAGETSATIPKFHTKNNDTLCDLMFVDPTMKTEKQIEQELQYFKAMRQPSGHMVVMLSYRTGKAANVKQVWKQKVSSGEINEQFTCTFDPISLEEADPMSSGRSDMLPDAIYVGAFTGK